jgi:hypothetical protein
LAFSPRNLDLEGKGSRRAMKWKLVCGVPWLLFLGLILSIDFQGADGELVVLLTLVLNIAAAPISFAVIGIIWVVEDFLGNFGLHITPRLGDFSKLAALVWWALTCALFYFQWFYLLPKCLSALRRFRSRPSS